MYLHRYGWLYECKHAEIREYGYGWNTYYLKAFLTFRATGNKDPFFDIHFMISPFFPSHFTTISNKKNCQFPSGLK